MLLNKNQWPLILSLIILWITTFVVTVLSLNNTNGHLIYVLDDPYIHMAVAKNFATYGVWGVTKYGFTSCTSSILWPGLLAGLFKIVGTNELIPFFLNIIFTSSTLILVYYILRKYVKKTKIYNLFIFFVLIAMIFFTPLIPLIFTGMEHVLQILLTIAFVYQSAKILSENKTKNSELVLLLILASLLTLNRYESFLTVFTAVILFVIHKKRFHALYLILCGSMPLILYGIISKIQGWSFLPNSIIMKSVFFDKPPYPYPILLLNKLTSIIFIPHLLVLLIIAFCLLVIILKDNTERKNRDFTIIILSIFSINLILHTLFAQTGWFYNRYEAYLIALGLLTISLGISLYLTEIENLKIWKNSIIKYSISILIICLIMTPMVTIAYDTLSSVPQSSKNIYEQQYQMALFLKEYYQGETVGLNDIGLINYMDDIKCLDLSGLANLEVAEKKIDGNFGVTEIGDVTKNCNASVIIIYDFCLNNHFPPGWIKVGEWEVEGNIACGYNKVAFFAPNQQNESYLKEKLRQFSDKLPKDVEQRGEYLSN